MKTTLTADEFAIQEGANFSLDTTKGVTVNIKDDGTMDITFSYKLNNAGTNLQAGPGQIKFKAGVFDKTKPNHFKKITKISRLTLSAGTTQVSLKSDAVDVDVVTDGEKGREGDSAMLAKKNISDSRIK